jgi:hypothetical protein
MVSDAYTLPMAQYDGRGGVDAARMDAYDRVAMRPQDVRGNLQNVVGHLENAERIVETQGMRAALSEYSAAIYAADRIDQRAVAQERQFVRQQLQNPNLDAQTRRSLLQEDSDLHTLQRAPGFARANLALLYIRNGYQADGVSMLMDAQQADPEMRMDPNFRRHLQSALRAGQRLMTDDAAPLQPNQPVQRNADGTPVQPRQGDQQLPGSQRPQDVTQPTDRIAPTDAQGHSPLQIARALFDQVTSPQALTPQMRQQFEQAIAASDQGFSPRLQQLSQQYDQALKAAVASLPDTNKNQVAAIDDQAQKLYSQLQPPEKAQAAQKLYSKLELSASAQERKAIEDQLVQAVPGIAPMLQQRDQLLGTDFLNKMYATNTIRNDFVDEANHAALTRYLYALALQKAGDMPNAQKYLVDAGNQNKNSDLVDVFQRTAQDMGLSKDKIGPVKDTPANPGQQNQTTDGQVPPSIQLLKQTMDQFDKAPNKAEALKTLGANYQQAISLADNEWTQANANYQKLLTPQLKQQLSDLDTQKAAEMKNLTPAETQSIQNAKSQQEFNTAMQTVLQAHPKLAQILQQEEQLKAPVLTAAQAVQMEQDAKFLTRSTYADALNKAGDKANATKMLNDAFNAVPADARGDYAKNQDVAKLMQALQVSVPGVTPGTGDATTGNPNARPGDQTVGQPQQPAQLSDLAQKNSFQDLVQLAEMKAKNGIKEAAPYYEAAIQRADAEGNPQVIAQKIKALQDALESGKYVDKTTGQERAVTADDRLQAHQAILQMLQQARAPMDAREEYAQMLKGAHQYKDAEKQLLDAKNAADQLPIALIRKETELLTKDANNPDIQELTRAKMNTLAGNVQKMTQVPLQIRYEIGRFYLGGGKNPNGTPIGDQQITGYDKNGQPIVEVVDTKVVNPEGAKKIVDELVAKQKEINGLDVAKEPKLDQNLAALRQATLENSPEELKKKIKDSGKIWEDASSSFWSTAAGLAVSVGILYATKGEGGALFGGRSALALLGAGAAGFGTATATDYGIQHLYYKNNDFGLGDAALQGGGPFAAAYGLLAFKGAYSTYRGANFTPEVFSDGIIKGVTQNGGQATAADLAGVWTKLGKAAPEGLAKVAASDPTKVLTAAELTELTGGINGMQAATILGKAFPGMALGGAETVMNTAGQTGGLVNNLTPGGTQILDAGTQATAQATDQVGRLGQLSNWLQNGPAWSPLARLSADAAPTAGALRASTFYTGFGAGMTYNVTNTGFASTKDWIHGAVGPDGKPITPWDAISHNMFTFTDANSPLPFGLNPRNMILQSALMAPFLGATKIGSPLYKSPIAAWSEAKGPITAFQEAKSPITAFQEAQGLGKITAPLSATVGKITAPVSATFGKLSAPITSQLSFGGKYALNWLNPGETNLTMFQAMRQAQFVPFAYFGANSLVESHALAGQSQVWQSVLDRTTKPIANETLVNPPQATDTKAPQQQQQQQQQQSRPADTQRVSQQQQNPTEANPEGGTLNGGVN